MAISSVVIFAYIALQSIKKSSADFTKRKLTKIITRIRPAGREGKRLKDTTEEIEFQSRL